MPLPIRKILITSASRDPSVVQLIDTTLPDPAEHEVQVQVLYSGFSGSDINMRLGVYPMQKTAPLTPGYCLVGRVHSAPGANPRFKSGALVAALTVYDAQATYANVPEKYLLPLPEEVDHAKACALVLDWNTAYGMVERAARVKKGDRVFVHGMSGAVGNALVQLCSLRGATVYGTASASKHEEIRSMGAHPFVYSDKKWMEAMKDVQLTAVFDPLGFESWDESYSVLSQKVSSVLVGYGGNMRSLNDEGNMGCGTLGVVWPTAKLLARNLALGKRSTKFFYIDRDQKTFVPECEALVGMLIRGEIDVRIKKVLRLDEVPEAHREWTRMGGIGSVVVKIAE